MRTDFKLRRPFSPRRRECPRGFLFVRKPKCAELILPGAFTMYLKAKTGKYKMIDSDDGFRAKKRSEKIKMGYVLNISDT